MRIILALGALAIVGLSGCVEDPYGYGYGTGAAYGGGGSYGGGGGGYGAPDPSARANYGEEYLSSGFDDDPRSVWVTSGGELDASSLGGECVGSISRAPDFQLTYDAGSLPLIFGVNAPDSDATLVINAPDGRWHCDDDSGGGTDPQISFYRPQSGVYDVWVGAFDDEGGEAELYITEVD